MYRERPVTLADVAKLADVSIATASRVLNGSLHRVSSELSVKVREAAARINYAPNVQAQSLARNTSSVVSVLVHDLTDQYFSQIAHGVLTAASECRIRVAISETGNSAVAERDHVESLRGFRPRAVIIIGSRTLDFEAEQQLAEVLDQLDKAGSTIVSVSQPGLPGACVYPENGRGARAVAEHLVSLGHRSFSVVEGPRQLRVVAERREAFVSALPEDTTVEVLSTDFSRDGGYQAGRQFVEVNRGATAVFVMSDAMASGFCTALREVGLRVGTDVSVAAFGDVPGAADLYPPLTTVRLPLVAMGRRALELAMFEQAAGVTTFEGQLVIRGSTGVVG